MNTKISLYFVAALLVMAYPLRHANAETILLEDDRTISAPIIKKTESTVFVDLGFDILRIPTEIITGIQETKISGPHESNIDDIPKEKSENSLYVSSDHHTVSTSKGAETNGPAVVIVKTPGGTGSGFFVNEDGYMITNFHVIKKQKHISITTFRIEKHELKRDIYNNVRIVAIDSFHDLAVLRVETDQNNPFPHVNLFPDDEPEVGEKVFAIGNPLGLERTITEGVLSHKNRLFSGNLYIQIDASVNPGNSGGPLFNNRGQVIGVINMSISSMQGLNFAIPVRHVKFLLNHIQAFAYDQSNDESGFIYVAAPSNPQSSKGN